MRTLVLTDDSPPVERKDSRGSLSMTLFSYMDNILYPLQNERTVGSMCI